ncbi:MAG: hypothetical protein GXP62_15665 [Oligoflexia bacterium]|nr:hypothetical protein [Oligoflexia bacterium]
MTRSRARVPTRLRVVANPGPVSAELLHPGPAEAFIGPHRQIEGGILTADGALLVLPELRAAVPDSRTLWIARRAALQAGVDLLRWDGAELALLRTIPCSDLKLGPELLVAWRGTRAWAEGSCDGSAAHLPLGALYAHARPWSSGAGASWVLGPALVQQTREGRPRVVGVANQPLHWLSIGPRGAALVAGHDRAWTHAPGQGLAPCSLERDLAGIEDPGQVAFSATGEQALVETDDGVALVDLVSGVVREQRLDGRPAGFGWWVDPIGERHRWQQSRGADWLPGPGVLIKGLLHGPGGMAWDLRTGQAAGPAATAGADLAASWDGGLVMVEGSEVRVGTASRTRSCFMIDVDDTALAVAAAGQLAAVRTSRGVAWGDRQPGSWHFLSAPLPPPGQALLGSIDGLLCATTPAGTLRLHDQTLSPQDLVCPDPDPLVRALGLPIDGSVLGADGSTWAWQDDGPLWRLRPPLTPN